jgi:hypothetical protein
VSNVLKNINHTRHNRSFEFFNFVLIKANLSIYPMKRTLSFFLMIVLVISALKVNSQETANFSKVNIGIGMGLDYGGIGGRLSYLPVKSVALFGAVGYNLLKTGFNAGGTFKFLPSKRLCPTIGAMYGYVAAIKVKGAEQYNQNYYGPSVSIGLEFKPAKHPRNFWNVKFIYPFRSHEYRSDLSNIKSNPYIKFENKPHDVTFSFGYHFGL